MNECKLILIEGIPGSGKSTTAERVKKDFDKRGIPSRLYLESDCNNPSDLAWVSLLDESKFDRLIEEYGEFKRIIAEYSERFGEYTAVYYQNMRNHAGVELPGEMLDYLACNEIYDGKSSLKAFCSLSMDRYRLFSEKACKEKEIKIFESSYLQNQINELLLFYDLDKNAIIAHLTRLAQSYEVLAPVLIYLVQSDVSKTISRVADERRSPDREKYPDWIDGIARYIADSNYGRKHGLNGFNGVIEYFERRRELELEAIERIGMKKIVIENNDYDVEDGISRVTSALTFRFV